jgi:hypothetical protein
LLSKPEILASNSMEKKSTQTSELIATHDNEKGKTTYFQLQGLTEW